MFSARARRARGVLLLVVTLVVGMTAGCGDAVQDESAKGPEWRTGPRAGVGSATAAEPARLGDITVAERAEFDRVTFSFDGGLPAYVVGYGLTGLPNASDVLTVVLRHVQPAGERLVEVSLPAVERVSREPWGSGSVRTMVIVSSGARLPFRVDISPGAFYVDVAHPGLAAGPP